MREDKGNSPKAEQQLASPLSDEQLAEASAGATEELKGAYNFLLEVAGVTGEAQRSQALAQPKSRDEMTDEQLEKAAAGASQTARQHAVSNLAFLRERAARNGYSGKEQAIQDLEAVKDGIRDY